MGKVPCIANQECWSLRLRVSKVKKKKKEKKKKERKGKERKEKENYEIIVLC
jgi:hypothetical protein